MTTTLNRFDKLRERSGQAAILVSLNLMFLFGMASLAIDLGTNYYRRGSLQTAADAAAAGAVNTASARSNSCGTGGGLTCGTAYSCSGTSLPTAIQAGCWYAEQNGATAAATSLLVGTSALNGGKLNPSLWIQATVTMTQTTMFSFMANSGSSTIAASAIGAIKSGSSSPYCVYILDSGTGSSDSITLNMSNGVQVNVGCGVAVNSPLTTGVTVVGGAKLTITQAGYYVSIAASGDTVNNGGSISPSSAVKTSQPSVSDPFGSVAAPTVGSCASYPSGYTTSGSTYSFSPGTYCSGISIANNQRVTFNSGTYIIKGGGFSVQGGSTVTSATGGVTFYNTGTTSGSGQIGAVNIANGTTVTLTAPTSGTYDGILFFQDRTIAVASQPTAVFAGGSTTNLTGSLYFPKANISYSNGSTSNTTGIVCYQLTFTGGTTLSASSNGTQTGLGTNGSGVLVQ